MPNVPIPSPYSVNLHLLSPIHVGTGEELDPFSYLIRDGRLHLIDLVAWMESYAQKAELARIMDSDNYAFIRTYIANHFDNPDAIRSSVPIDDPKLLEEYQQAIEKQDPKNQVLVSPTMRNPVTMQAYLPGSSIKGAIRTAIANRFVQAAGVRSHDAKRCNEKIFGRIKNDPMRWLKLSDLPVGASDTVIMEAREFSRDESKSLTPKGHKEVFTSQCYRQTPCIYPLKLLLAPFTLHGQPIDARFILDALRDFYVPKYVNEFDKFYSADHSQAIADAIVPISRAVAALKTNEALIRIGMYSHVECVTLDGVRNPKTRKGKDGKFLPYGQTRTLANGLYPFGWAKLEFTDLPSEPRPEQKWPFPLEKQKRQRPKPPTAKASPPLDQGPVAPPPSAPKPLDPDQFTQSFQMLVQKAKVIKAGDKLAIGKLVEALETDLTDENEQRELARMLKQKLEAAGIWKKHPLMFDIQVFLN